MILYMLDSSFCIDVMRNKAASLRSRFKTHSASMCISTVVLHELMYGAANGQNPAAARLKVDEFCSALLVLPFDGDAAAHAADIRAALRREGRTIGGYDVLIAGHARSLDLTLITGNLNEFTRVADLRCEDWSAEDAP